MTSCSSTASLPTGSWSRRTASTRPSTRRQMPQNHKTRMSSPWVPSRRERTSSQRSRQPRGRTPLVVVGPEKNPRRAGAAPARARLEGHVSIERLAESYRGAACLVQSSRFEASVCRSPRAMASGTPVVAVREPALRGAADAALFVDEGGLAEGIKQALRERERLSAPDSSAHESSLAVDGRKTLAVYREVLGA